MLSTPFYSFKIKKKDKLYCPSRFTPRSWRPSFIGCTTFFFCLANIASPGPSTVMRCNRSYLYAVVCVCVWFFFPVFILIYFTRMGDNPGADGRFYLSSSYYDSCDLVPFRF